MLGCFVIEFTVKKYFHLGLHLETEISRMFCQAPSTCLCEDHREVFEINKFDLSMHPIIVLRCFVLTKEKELWHKPGGGSFTGSPLKLIPCVLFGCCFVFVFFFSIRTPYSGTVQFCQQAPAFILTAVSLPFSPQSLLLPFFSPTFTVPSAYP